MKPSTVRRLPSKLRRLFPTYRPVVVYFRALGADGPWAWTEQRRNRLYIVVNSDLPPLCQYMLVIHEWAHAMTWRPAHQERIREADHDPEWGVAHARIWRTLFCEQGDDKSHLVAAGPR